MRRFLLYILCLSASAAMAQPVPVANQPYAVKSGYFDSLTMILNGQRLPQAEKTLQPLVEWAGRQGDIELPAQLKLLLLKRKMMQVSQDDTLEWALKSMISFAARKSLRLLEADALQALGNYYWNNDQKHSLALENFVESYNIYSRYSSTDFPPKQKYLYDLGGSYFRYEDYENAVKYLNEALAAKPARNTNVDLSNTLFNTLGLCYLKLNKLDSARQLFTAIYNKARSRNDTVWTGIAAGNIGNICFLEKKYDEAIPMLETDVNNSLATTQIKSAAGSMYKLAVIYYIKNDIDRSLSLLLNALSICEKKSFWPSYPLAEQIYAQLARNYAAKKDMAHAYAYADSALTAKDSVVAERYKLNIARSQEKIDFIRHKLETGKLISEKQMSELIRNGLVALILMMCVISILFVNRQRLRQKKLEAEKKNAESELDIAAMQLANMMKSVHEKNEIIEHFTAELERLKTGSALKVDDELLAQLERATILTDAQWDNFRDIFEKVHRGFFSNLKKKIPDLTPAEIRFLALTKLKLSSKEMASMLGISTNAIRMYRHRLRRKLELDKEDMIEALVESI